MIPAQFVDWTWNLTGYVAKVPFYNADDLTMREVQLDSISPEASLMDIDTVDPYRSLYFSLCY